MRRNDLLHDKTTTVVGDWMGIGERAMTHATRHSVLPLSQGLRIRAWVLVVEGGGEWKTL